VSSTCAKARPARHRLVDAAFDLFEERGFEQTTVDDLAERAGVGRSTFFRHFRAKEDVALADHDQMLANVKGLLRPTDERGRPRPTRDLNELAERVAAAARSVVEHYVLEGERARRRYRLSATVPAIRSRESAGMRSYQRAFLVAVHEGRGDLQPSLESELAANSAITATHYVLRRWLREESETPYDDFDRAIGRALTPWLPTPDSASPDGCPPPEVALTARRATPLLEQLLTELRSLSGG
jgi:AcrR family transcriptional regulator